MNKNDFSPYVRVAMFSTLTAPFKIDNRIIFDYEIIFVSDGECKITIEDTEYLCKKDDVVFIRPDINHKFDVEKNDFVQPHIHFDISYSQKSEKTGISFKPKNKMTKHELSLVQKDIFKDLCIPYVFKPKKPDAFKNLLFEIIELFQRKAYNYELLSKSKMLELLALIIEQFDTCRTTDSELILNPITAVKDYIDNNYPSIITLESLSKQFYFNKYTLLRKFRATYDQNIISYYHEKRVKYIKELLSETELPISTIAEKLNFSDIYSLSRFFKTKTGYSPTDYRKNYSRTEKRQK